MKIEGDLELAWEETSTIITIDHTLARSFDGRNPEQVKGDDGLSLARGSSEIGSALMDTPLHISESKGVGGPLEGRQGFPQED